MLALREYFWIDTDWTVSSNAATALSITGPSQAIINVATPYTIFADGSISGVLVVNLVFGPPSNNTTGTYSPSAFSFSAGLTSASFTFTPLNFPTGPAFAPLNNTNSQSLSHAAKAVQILSAPAIVIPPSGGGGGHKKDEYHPLPDDFWEIRERYLRRHLTPVIERVHIPEELQHHNPVSEETALQKLLQLRETARASAALAKNAADLRADTAKTLKLTLDIQRLIDQYYEQAAIILLLDVS